MTDLAEIKNMVVAQGNAVESFIKRHEGQYDALENELHKLVKGNTRAQFSPAVSETKPAEQLFDVKSGKVLRVLSHNDSFAASHKTSGVPSIGRLLRGVVLGGKAHDADELAEERKALGINPDPSGGYTVQGALAAEWIDALRANMVLSKAGVRCLDMPTSQLSLAKVASPPTCSWHAENAALGTGDPTFGQVNLNAKTVVCLVRLSLELSQDAANLESMLQQSITSSMAAAIDRAGLVGTTTDANGAPLGVFNLAGRSKVLTIGAPTSWDYLVDGMYNLAAANVPMESIGAFIAHPAVWKKMRKLKTGLSGDNTPLTMPEEIAALPKLWTTSAPLTGGTTAAGVVGDWSTYLMGCRQDITVRVLSESFMGSNLQMAILAYARVDFAALRPESFCTLEGITV